MTKAEIAAIARGLTEAQREALMSGKWNADPVCADFLMAGIVKRMPTVSWPYYVELSPLGHAVRDYLKGTQP